MKRVCGVFVFIVIGVLTASCTQVVKVPTAVNSMVICETKETTANPPQFYLCGEGLYPCAPKADDLRVSVEKPIVQSSELIQTKPQLNYRRSTKHEKHVHKTKCHCK